MIGHRGRKFQQIAARPGPSPPGKRVALRLRYRRALPRVLSPRGPEDDHGDFLLLSARQFVMADSVRLAGEARPAAPLESGLPRSMGAALAASIVVSNVIGVGIFTTSGLLARDLGDPRLLLGIWLAGGVMALAGALCYAELGANFPRAGGEYAYLREVYGPLPSFLSGWASLLAGFSAPIAASSIGFTEYLSFYFPRFSTARAGLSAGHLMASLVIVLLSAVHYRKVKIGGRVHLGLTSFKVGVIVLFVIAGFLLGRGDPSHVAGTLPIEAWRAKASAL